MKKNILYMSILLIMMLFLCSCGQKTSSREGEKKEPELPPKDVKTYTLKMNASIVPIGKGEEWVPTAFSTKNFGEKVEKATNGRVKVDVFYNNQLSPQPQALEALKKGVIDMQYGASYWGGTVPESDVHWLPFSTKGEEHALHLMRETKVGEIFEAAYQKQGVHVLFYVPVSFEALISKKPVRNFADLKGLRVRVGSALWPGWYKEMGVAPVNVSNAEQYEALMRGTMDATIYPVYSALRYKFNEVCKYIILPGVVDPMLTYVMVNQKAWDSLPDDLRKIVEKVALECEKESIAASKKAGDWTLEEWNKLGLEVIRFNKTEFEKLKQSAMTLWDEFGKKTPQCAEMVKVIREDLKNWEANRPESKQWDERWLVK